MRAATELCSETARDAIWTVDLDLNFSYVSPSVTDALGYGVQEVMARRPLDLLTSQSRERILALRLDRRDPIKAAERGATISHTEEVALLHKDGSIRWAEITMTVLRDEGGRATGVLGISRDLTDRKRAETQVQEGRERLRLALEGGNLPLWDWHIQTGELFLDERAADILGYTQEELEPSLPGWASLVHPDDFAPIRQAFNAHVTGQTPMYDAEFRFPHKSGEWKWISPWPVGQKG